MIMRSPERPRQQRHELYTVGHFTFVHIFANC